MDKWPCERPDPKEDLAQLRVWLVLLLLYSHHMAIHLWVESHSDYKEYAKQNDFKTSFFSSKL